MVDVKEQIAEAIIGTLLATYPENDPKARARRFFPLFAKIGTFTTGLLIILGAVFLFLYSFPLHDFACMLYGITVLPFLGVGAYFVSMGLYKLTVSLMRIKDFVVGPPQHDVDL